ncbi:tRNA (adenosine(37)-N6)-threonylcarbamoyltransferase complex ATPase subunit type 1 TsaE [Candidatus Nomurabacteria bacterium]|nr:tRNA (adenosine(37)-N6)-threonylcarbamoyltransferase complex ATPase subunit type 1 TsaE [Candidatus Nomurabacteria bacterium]
MNGEYDITNKADLESVAAQLATYLQSHQTDVASVVALHGELGAGKTTFVQALAASLGIAETVTSPTFLIMRSYKTTAGRNLVHIDAYRVEAESELTVLGFEELLHHPENIICIEWAERIAGLLPKHTLQLTFALASDGVRTVTIS